MDGGTASADPAGAVIDADRCPARRRAAGNVAAAEQGNQEVAPVRGAVLRYRVMAFITGVLIIVVCFAGIPLQLAAHQTFIVNQVGTVHGYLYLVYLVFAWMLASRLKLPRGRMVVLLLAGTIPVMTFIVERWMTRRYIAPALAAEAAEAAGAPATQAQPEGAPPTSR
jgi:integral membrane protein